MIIPHDHHIADSDTCHDIPFPVSNNGHTRHPGFPSHCHAFNDLASEKAITFHIVKQVQTHDFLPGNMHGTEVSAQLPRIRIIDRFTPPIIHSLPELSFLRAPPVLG